jgi:hypothetical protein
LDLDVGWLWPFPEQRSGSHNHATLTIAALWHLLGNPGLLDGMRAIGRQSLNRRNFPPGGFGDGHRARPDGATVYMHGAGTAGRDSTTIFGARQSQLFADDPQQGCIRVDLYRSKPIIDLQKDH